MRLSLNLLIALCIVLLACSSNEEGAAEKVAQAESLFQANRTTAIKELEDALLKYPNTKAGERARTLLPFWLHAQALSALADSVKNTSATSPLVWSPLAGSESFAILIRILEDFPDYEYREALEAQVICLITIDNLVPVLQDTATLEASSRETQAAMAEDSPMLMMNEAETEAWESRQIERNRTQRLRFQVYMRKQASAFRITAQTLRSIRTDHSLSEAFSEVASSLDDTADYLRDVEEASQTLLGDKVLDCRMFLLRPVEGFLDRILGALKRSRCRDVVEESDQLQRKVDEKASRLTEGLAKAVERSKPAIEELSKSWGPIVALAEKLQISGR